MNRATRHGEDAGAQTGYLELIRGNVNFRRLWVGTIISLLGDWFNFIALVTLIGRETGSPFAVAMTFIAKMLPLGLASPVAGLIVDRFNRRRLMIGADVLRAVIVAGLILVEGPGTIWLAYVLTMLQMVAGAVSIPARSASIPNVTTPRELLTANALLSASWSVMLAIGAAMGGFATEWLGPRPVFLLDSLTYLLSASFIYYTVIPQAEMHTSEGSVVKEAARKIMDGWRHLWRHPQIGRIALAKAAWSVAGGASVFMLTLLGEEVAFGMQAAGIGVLFMARGIGTGIGPVAARALFKNDRQWPAVLGWCIIASGLCYGAVGYAAWTAWVALLVIAAHAFSGANWVLATVLLQKRTIDQYRGRIFSTEWLLVMLADTLSILTASLLIEFAVLDLRACFQVFAGVQIGCGLLWLVLIVPRERCAYES